MELNEVAADLAKHEAVCAERWKTAFNKFASKENSFSDWADFEKGRREILRKKAAMCKVRNWTWYVL